MDKRQRFTRYVVVREGSTQRYLQRFMSIPNTQWTRHKPLAMRFATAEEAEAAAKKAEKYLKRLGMRWTVSYELVQTGLDDFFNS
jgi:hypothetical protein